MVNGTRANHMDLELKVGQMVVDMKEIGLLVNQLALESKHIKMELQNVVNGKEESS